MVRYEKEKECGVMTKAIITMPTTSAYDIRCLQAEICDVIRSYNPEMLGGVRDTPYYWLLTLLEATLPTEDECLILEHIRNINADSSPKDLQEWFNKNKKTLQCIHDTK